MRRLFRLLVALVIVVIVGLLVAPYFIPMDVYKSQITRAAENATGRALTIDGELKLAFFPQFQVEMNDVTFANRDGASPANMATMEQLSLGLAVIPLILERRIVIERLVLERPVIVMDVDRRGRGNWEFDIETDDSGPAEGENDADGGFFLNEVNLGDVRLVRGDVTYSDARSGASYHLEDINLTVSLPTLSGPLGLDGRMTYNGERINLDTTIASPRDFLDGTATGMDLALRSDVMQLEFSGTASAATAGSLPIRGGGEIDLNVPSVRRLAAWQGSAIQSPGGFGPMRITGQANANGDLIDFNNATIAIDDMAGTGNFALDMGGTRPRMNGDLALNRIDVRPYIGEGTTRARNRGNASSEWSDDPIDLSALRGFDLDLDIVADEIITPTLRMGRSVVDLNLRNGVLVAALEEMALYEGSGTARFEVDARNAEAIIRQQASFDLVQALPLFTDLANFRSLEGIGNITVDLTTRGRSQRDFMSAMNGTGELRFHDGMIKGMNIASTLRMVSSLMSGSELQRGPQDTDFAELGGTFQIRNGVVTNTDMRLLNPLLRISGTGSTSLIDRSVDYRIDPQLVLILEGQGSTRDISNDAIPLIIGGTWDDLDFSGTIAAIGGRLLQDALGLGQRNDTAISDTEDSAAPQESEPDAEPQAEPGANTEAEDMLGGFFNRRRNREESQDTEEPEAATETPAEEQSEPVAEPVAQPVVEPEPEPVVGPEPEPPVEEPVAQEPEPEPEPVTEEPAVEEADEELTREERRQRRREENRERRRGD